MNSTRVLGALLIASLVDLAAIVVTGDVSFLGSVGSTGFVLRIAFALVLLGVSYVRRKEPRRAALYGYAVVLLVLVSLLHVRGYRLRGDGLWYYSYAHSVAIDGDVDLGNQYRRLGIDTARGSQTVRETGRARYTFPVGAPLAWVPFVWLGHVGAAFRNAYGLETAYDGYADPYFHAVALGNLLIGWLGLLVLDRFLRRWFPPWVAFWATAGVGLGSFFSWYLAYHSIYTHALTFLLIVLFLELWVRGPSSVREYALLGLVLGAAACVRWQNAVFCLLPAYTLAGKLCQKDWRFVAGAGRGVRTRGAPRPCAPVLELESDFWKLLCGRTPGSRLCALARAFRHRDTLCLTSRLVLVEPALALRGFGASRLRAASTANGAASSRDARSPDLH